MMIPITRKEKYEIVGGGNTAPETPQTREEIFFADILGEVVAPSPITRAEKYLAKIANKYSGELPEPVTRIERFLARAAGMNVSIPTPVTREEIYWDTFIKTQRVVYGWHIDPTISNSFNAVTYLEDAVGMAPAAMGESTFDYGSWKNAFFMPKPCMLKSDGTVDYYLDPNDYTKKADGTLSDVANPDYDGNTMMEWGKIWYKFVRTEIDGEGYFYVSNYRVDNTYHCWCNIDSENNETDHFYTAIYNGTGTTKLRSISGVALTSANGNGNTNVTQEVTRATANNTTSAVEWYTEVFSDKLLINALLVLLGKSLNTQTTFGRGLDTGGQTEKEAYITGTLNDKGLFWGVTANGNSAVKVFGMENWWGCVWRRAAGCISVDNALKVKLTYGTADGSTVNGYNQTGNGYIDNGNIPTSNDYIKTMRYNELGYSPSSVTGGSSTTYYGDYFYQNTGTRYLMLGGAFGLGVGAGAFCFSLSGAPGQTLWYVATALSCKPLARKNPETNLNQSLRTFTVYFYNGSTLLQTAENVQYGGTATYTGETPAKDGFTFSGWQPSNVNITADTSCYAQFTEG